MIDHLTDGSDEPEEELEELQPEEPETEEELGDGDPEPEEGAEPEPQPEPEPEPQDESERERQAAALLLGKGYTVGRQGAEPEPEPEEEAEMPDPVMDPDGFAQWQEDRLQQKLNQALAPIVRPQQEAAIVEGISAAAKRFSAGLTAEAQAALKVHVKELNAEQADLYSRTPAAFAELAIQYMEKFPPKAAPRAATGVPGAPGPTPGNPAAQGTLIPPRLKGAYTKYTKAFGLKDTKANRDEFMAWQEDN